MHKLFNRTIKPFHRDVIVSSEPIEVVDVPVFTEPEVEDKKKDNDVQ